ncbi:MAG: hypothetical protein AAGA42_03890 [Actinomycetota bacterium]
MRWPVRLIMLCAVVLIAAGIAWPRDPRSGWVSVPAGVSPEVAIEQASVTVRAPIASLMITAGVVGIIVSWTVIARRAWMASRT